MAGWVQIKSTRFRGPGQAFSRFDVLGSLINWILVLVSVVTIGWLRDRVLGVNICSSEANGPRPTPSDPMANLTAGQVETLLPALLEALEAERTAKANAAALKAQMATLIGEPQTVKTAWGTVTLCNGRRTVKVTDRALNAQITLLKEQGIALGKCEESFGVPYIQVKTNDR